MHVSYCNENANQNQLVFFCFVFVWITLISTHHIHMTLYSRVKSSLSGRSSSSAFGHFIKYLNTCVTTFTRLINQNKLKLQTRETIFEIDVWKRLFYWNMLPMTTVQVAKARWYLHVIVLRWALKWTSANASSEYDCFATFPQSNPIQFNECIQIKYASHILWSATNFPQNKNKNKNKNSFTLLSYRVANIFQRFSIFIANTLQFILRLIVDKKAVFIVTKRLMCS